MSGTDLDILELGHRYRVPVCRIGAGGELKATGHSVELTLIKGSINAADSVRVKDGVALETLLKLLIVDLEHKAKIVESEESPRMLFHLHSALDGMRARAHRRWEQGVLGTYQK
jgi:hypothetical protein